MKNTIKSITSIISIILSLVIALGLASCGGNKDPWEDATYLTDTELGNGATTLVVEVKVNENSVKFTINTDQETVGAALIEHNLIEGEDSQYGLYIKKVNGITADYDVDMSYWAFYVDSEYASSGVESTAITEGTNYQLVYTK